MADVTLDSSASTATNENRALWGPYWTSPSVGYTVNQEGGFTDDIEVRKTVDSGATFAVQDTANEPSSNTNASMACWFDQETPGNSGTLIHVAWLQITDNEVHYDEFDTADDAWNTDRTIDSLTINIAGTSQDISVTVAKGGRTHVVARGDFAADTENTDHSHRSSSDGFATNNESEASPYSSDEEQVLLFPGADADEDDICALVMDCVNLDFEFWKFDADANSWGVTSIDTSISVTATEMRLHHHVFNGAIQHSDEHIIAVYWNDLDQSTGDFRCVDITQATPTITQRTDVHSNTDDSFLSTLLINQQNDDWYVAYVGSDDGSEAFGSLVSCYFKKSTDGGSIWGTEQTYSVQNDDLKAVSLGRTIGDAGGRVMPVWFNDDTNDILANDGNDPEIAAVTSAFIPRVMVY